MIFSSAPRRQALSPSRVETAPGCGYLGCFMADRREQPVGVDGKSIFGAEQTTSFWKRGPLRSGSNIGRRNPSVSEWRVCG